MIHTATRSHDQNKLGMRKVDRFNNFKRYVLSKDSNAE